MDSTLYKQFFSKVLNEDMTAGDGGVFGDQQDINQGDLGDTTRDTYAKGDARLPKILGSKIQRRGSTKKKKKSKKSKKVS